MIISEESNNKVDPNILTIHNTVPPKQHTIFKYFYDATYQYLERTQ